MRPLDQALASLRATTADVAFATIGGGLSAVVGDAPQPVQGWQLGAGHDVELSLQPNERVALGI